MGLHRKSQNAVKRRRIFINAPFQLRYMAYFLTILTIVSAVVFFNFYFGVWDGILEGLSTEKIGMEVEAGEVEKARTWAFDKADFTMNFLKKSEQLNRRQREVFQNVFEKTNEKLIPSLVILVIIIIFASILLTFRIVGPYYRIHKDLKAVDRGDLRIRIQLRKGDEGRSVADDINGMINHFDLTIANLKMVTRDYDKNPDRMMARLKEELAQFRTSADKPDKD